MLEKIEDFLNLLSLEKGSPRNTLIAYRNDLTQLARYLNRQHTFEVKSWDEVNKDIIVAYILYLKEREYATSTVARKVAATKSFFHFLVTEELIEDDPTATLDSPKVKKQLPKAISGEEVELLLAEPARHSTPKALRDKAMLELMYATGMRATELVELDIDDVNLPSNSVRVIGKGDKERIIPIHGRAVKSIETYLRKGRLELLKDPDEKALFLNPRGKRLTRQGLWLIIKHYVERAGLDPDITPHTLRHSFATHMLESKEATLVDVQQFLGHANISTTQIYTRVTSKHKRQVYDRAHPRAK
ncbi:MAG: site-specific tyrosine recombinase XerD [Chloroflexi bacterium]|nr:site-specific tyrosine recombinase XerD [Chloroflexota bacterium]